MKSLKFAALAAAGLFLLSACGPEKGKDINEMSNLTEADSAMYYFGQMRAGEYWREAQRDTALKTREARDAYLKGLKAGMDLVKAASGENDINATYNQGVFMGVQIAMNMAEFDKTYETKSNKSTVLQSIAYGLENDSVVKDSEAQSEFYGIMNRLDEKKEAADKANSATALASEASKLQMTKINDQLYGKVLKAGNGTALKQGDKIDVEMTLKKANGEKIDMQLPKQIEIGNKYMSGPFSDALSSMTDKETKEFATTAYELFGSRTSQMGYKATDVMLVTIEIKGIDGAAPAQPGEIRVANPDSLIKK